MKLHMKTFLAVFVLIFVSSCNTSEKPLSENLKKELSAKGLSYEVRILKEPRPIIIRLVRADLSNKSLRFDVVAPGDPDGDGPANSKLTDPVKLAQKGNMLLAINCNPWSSVTVKAPSSWSADMPVKILGLAAAEGEILSEFSKENPRTTLWFDDKMEAFIGKTSPDDKVITAISGFHNILTDGKVINSKNNDTHPRTAIGLSKDKRTLWISVVDGRQSGYSEGMTVMELGEFFSSLGASDAINLDGGGSSIIIMSTNGRATIFNSPSDRYLGFQDIRPLPIMFGVKSAK